MPNPFAHIELTTNDLGTAKQFYKKLFGWKLADMKSPDGTVYTMIAPGTGPGGGMQAKPMPDAPVTWLPYVEVEDVAKSLAKAQKGGATVTLPFTDIGDMGSIGIFSDPAGALLGLWAKAKVTVKKKAKQTAALKAVKKVSKKKARKKT